MDDCMDKHRAHIYSSEAPPESDPNSRAIKLGYTHSHEERKNMEISARQAMFNFYDEMRWAATINWKDDEIKSIYTKQIDELTDRLRELEKVSCRQSKRLKLPAHTFDLTEYAVS